MIWGGRREEGSGWGTHVYLWWIHFDIWQNKYNYVKFKNKIKLKKKKEREREWVSGLHQITKRVDGMKGLRILALEKVMLK